jgi:glycosyltransferase involved in cell wall biosynthesis
MAKQGTPAGRSLSVVLPAFNEEENIRLSVVRCREALREHFADFEIIIVDDCSTDRTAALADELAAAYAEVRVIHHPRNRKLGGTLRTGFAAAAKDLVFYTDADLPIDFRDIPRGVELLSRDGVDAVLGYRLDRTEGAWRALLSAGYNLLVNAVFGLGVRDVNFSFKLFPRTVVERLELQSEGSFIDAEMLARAKSAGVRWAELGVHYYPRRAGRSTLAGPAVIAKILREMRSFWWNVWRAGRRAAGAGAASRGGGGGASARPVSSVEKTARVRAGNAAPNGPEAGREA